MESAEKSQITKRPVTTSGWYETVTGHWVECLWDRGLLRVSPVYTSKEMDEKKRAWERMVNE